MANKRSMLLCNSTEQSVIKTVLYSDIFDYPLSSSEIWRFLVSSKKIPKKDFDKVLANIKEPLMFKDGWYFIKGRESIVRTRTKRKKESEKKIIRAKKIAHVLSFIPSVLFIGISGGLSVKNADKKDDIDFFLLTKKGTLWSTRAVMLLVLELLGLRRKRGEENAKDKICLNMIVEESSMGFDKDRQDLYTAREISQMMPLFERENTYVKFMKANKWVEKYLPNSFDIKTSRYQNVKTKGKNIASFLLSTPNFVAREIQMRLIKRHKTSEQVKSDFAAFHPYDYKSFILKEYNKRLKKFGLS